MEFIRGEINKCSDLLISDPGLIHVQACRLLVSNGADINAQTHGDITPLHLAASQVGETVA
jgi:ankyrin repeat protein